MINETTESAVFFYLSLTFLYDSFLSSAFSCFSSGRSFYCSSIILVKLTIVSLIIALTITSYLCAHYISALVILYFNAY